MSRQSCRLRIIAHDAGFRSELRQLLEADPEGRYSLVEAGTPDCMLLAHEPPDVDALEVLAALRKGRPVPPCPVVILPVSTAGGRELERAVLRAGAMECVERGALDARTLTRAIENAVERFTPWTAPTGSSEAQLEAILNAMADGVVVFDMAGNVVLLNEAEARICGFASAAEMKRDLPFFADIYELSSDDGRLLPVEEWPVSRVLRGETVGACELRTRRRDTGQEWRIHFSGAPVRDEAGRQVLAIVITRDLTAQARAEKALRESQRRYQALFESIDDGFCLVQMLFDAHGRPMDYRFLEANAAFESHTGLRNAVGRSMRELVPGHDESWFQSYGDVALNGGAIRFEEHASAMNRWFEVYATRAGEPESRRVAIVFKDISERKRAEQALRESKERFEALADNISQLAWMADETGSLFWYNQRWFDYTGTTFEEMQGWGWRKVHHPEHVERVTERFTRHIASGEVWEDTFPLRSRTGEYRWFLSRARPIRDASGRVRRWFGTNTDITAQLEAEAQLKEALRARDEFLSIASHELRTPLTSLKLQLQMTRRRIERGDPSAYAPEQVSKLVEQGNHQLARLARLVNDMLDIARIQTGRLVIEPGRMDAVALTREVLERLGPHLAESGTPATLEAPERLEAEWDPFRIEQVVTNLLTNAMRYGDHKPVAVALRAHEGRILLSVKDQGLGIREESQERIFNRFERAISANDVSGLGLGLFISRQIVEAHGGRIWVESEGPGRGATFFVELPAFPDFTQLKPPGTKLGAAPRQERRFQGLA